MKILVDADACPVPVREIIIRAAVKRNIKTVFIANQKLKLPSESCIQMIEVEQGPDIADDLIVDLAGPGDLIVSEDIPLADRAISRGAVVITTRGLFYTEENIKGRLATRDLLETLRSGGLETSGPGVYSQRDRRMFADQFDRFIQRNFCR